MTVPERDLEHILQHSQGVWEDLRGASIFVTGGTGFFGRWMVESFRAANREFQLGARMIVLSRTAQADLHDVSYCTGDVRTFDFPLGNFTHVLHLATPASAALNESRPFEMQEICVDGTRRVLNFAKQRGVRKLLLASSGAVYGRQPPELEKISEDFMGGPDPLDPKSAYAEGKRMAEWMCAASLSEAYSVLIARGFAFVGPYLPLNTHFAAGNFIGDALAGRPIVVQGDGTAVRSYLFAADLAIWLWTILLRGESGRAYNVGSEKEISIADLARLVAGILPTTVEVRGTPLGGKPERYIPSTARARNELHLQELIDLPEAIRRTVEWHHLVPSP